MNLQMVKQITRKFRSIADLPSWLQTGLPYHVQIRIIRSALGMTQTQLAKRLHSQQATVNRMEKGDVSPTITTLQKVAEELNCELKVLLVPKKPIIQFLEEKALRIATSIIRVTVSSSALEFQKPSAEMIRDQTQELKEEILKKNRSILWKDL